MEDAEEAAAPLLEFRVPQPGVVQFTRSAVTEALGAALDGIQYNDMLRDGVITWNDKTDVITFPVLADYPRAKSLKAAVICYLRVSSDRQVVEGGGLKDQMNKCSLACTQKWGPDGQNWTYMAVFKEAASGFMRHDKRYELEKALKLYNAAAKNKLKPYIVVGHITRLYRDATMYLLFQEKKIRTILADMPGVDAASAVGQMNLGVMAVIGQYEAEMIRARTHDGLERAKAVRKQRMQEAGGDPSLAPVLPRAMTEMSKTLHSQADAWKKDLGNHLEPFIDDAYSLRHMAKKMNDMGLKTFRVEYARGSTKGGCPITSGYMSKIFDVRPDLRERWMAAVRSRAVAHEQEMERRARLLKAHQENRDILRAQGKKRPAPIMLPGHIARNLGDEQRLSLAVPLAD